MGRLLSVRACARREAEGSEPHGPESKTAASWGGRELSGRTNDQTASTDALRCMRIAMGIRTARRQVVMTCSACHTPAELVKCIWGAARMPRVGVRNHES